MNTAWELFTRADRIQELSEAMIVWSAKGAIVLALAGATAWLLRRSTARTRHLAWALAVVGVLLLPGVEGLIPGWSIQGLLPAPEGPEPATVVVEPTPIPPVESRDCTGTPTATEEGRVPPSPSGVTKGDRDHVAEVWRFSGASPTLATLSEDASLPLVLWLLGLVAFAIRPLTGVFRRRRILREARPVSPGTRKLLQELRTDLGVSRSVRLVQVPGAAVPMTWGTLRPVIVLPATSEGWPRARLRHVLLHELAHVARCDACLFAAARILCVTRWFDPLAWYAARRLRAEAELACDDRVLIADDRAALYAGHLLESLREARGGAPAGAIAMARSSQLGSRIEAILEPGRRHRPSRRALLAGAIVGVTVLLPLSALTFAEPPAPPKLPNAPSAPEWTWDASKAPEPPSPEALLPGEPSLSLPEVPFPTDPLALPSDVPPSMTDLPAPDLPTPELAAVRAPTPPEPPTVASTAPGPGIFRTISLHHTDREGFFDHPDYEDACDGGWLGIEDRLHSSQIRGDDDRWSLAIDHAGCSLEVELRGDVRLELLDGGIESLGARAHVRIQEETKLGRRLLRVTPGPSGQPRHDYRIDGREAPVDASVRSWLARVTAEVFRATGYRARERVVAILRHRGAEGVLREIERISSDPVHRLYAAHLMDEADLSAVELERLLVGAGEGIGSDHEMAELLLHAAPTIDSPRTRRAYLEAAETVGSDFEARRILEALARGRRLDSESLRLLLDVAQGIGSDFEMAEALRTLLAEWPGDEPIPGLFFRAVKTIGSDHEARRVLTAVPGEKLDAEGWRTLLEAARGIGSDFEMAELLISVARESPGPLSGSFFEALATVGSDSEARRVLEAVVIQQDLTPQELVAVLEASRSIGSDHELSGLLLTIGRRYALEGPVRAAYLDASRTVGSPRERERLLRAANGG